MQTDAVSLTALRVLRHIADTGSFAAAADDLGYSQSAVSRQMAALERAVGETLFERGRRGSALTPAGEVLLTATRRILADLDGTARQLGELHDQLGGHLSAGAFPSAAAALLPRAVADVLADHPALHVSIDEAASPTLVRRVRARRLHVAVVAVAQSADLDGLNRHPLTRIGLRVAVPDAHRLAGRGRVRPADLADEPWIVGAGAAGDPQFGAWPTTHDPRIAYSVRHWPTRLGLVAAGLGISVLPGAATPSVPAGVTVLTVDDPAAPARSGIVVTAQEPTAQAMLLVRALQRTARSLAD